MKWGVYMVVEGEQTEKRLYRAWLQLAFPNWRQVSRVEDVVQSAFFIVASKGYPDYKERIRQACADIRDGLGQVHHFFACVDAEECTYTDRFAEIQREIDLPEHVRAHVIVQDCCIETWLLGNRRFISPNTNDAKLAAYLQHYNFREHDPEQMPSHQDFSTRSRFHLAYLRQAFIAKGAASFTYSKRNPGHAAEETYWRALVQRHTDTGHLFSFGKFCESLRAVGATL